MSKKLFDRKDVKEIAIEFAKFLMSTEVSRARYNGDVSSYSPVEFGLMRGELEAHGKQLFESFVDSYPE